MISTGASPRRKVDHYLVNQNEGWNNPSLPCFYDFYCWAKGTFTWFSINLMVSCLLPKKDYI